MKSFQGRVVVPGTVSAEALVSRGGFNTLASFQMALQFGDLKALGKEQTIGSTTGGMVLFAACALGKQPACMLFSKPIDSLAASGAILGDVWTDAVMPVVDNLGDEFLASVQTGMTVTVRENGIVEIE